MFSKYYVLPLLGVVLAGVCRASPAPVHRPVSLAPRSQPPVVFNPAKLWQDATLYHGTAAPAAGEGPAVQLGLSLAQAAVSGAIGVEVSEQFPTEATITVRLGGFRAYFELILAASAGVSESIELVASEKLSLAIPHLLHVDADAAFALDLVVAVSAAVDISAGFHVEFPDDAFVEISMVSGEIVKHSLDGLEAQTFPVSLGGDVDVSAEIELEIGLRLRAEVGIGAGLEIAGLDIGAGVEVAVWANLFYYQTTVAQTSSCPLSCSEAYYFNVGVAVKADVDIADIVHLSLVPAVTVTLATAPEHQLCLDYPGGAGGSPAESSSSLPSSAAAVAASSSQPSSGAVTARTTTTFPYSVATAFDGPSDLTTSTVVVTHTYTITSCHASVPNCPASYTQKVITSTIVSKITVCPATSTTTSGFASTTLAFPSSSTSSSPASSTSPTCSFPTPTTEVRTITLTTCPDASSSTFTPPADTPTPTPTVTVVDDSTTVCSETLSATVTLGNPSIVPTGAPTLAASTTFPASSLCPSSSTFTVVSTYPVGPSNPPLVAEPAAPTTSTFPALPSYDEVPESPASPTLPVAAPPYPASPVSPPVPYPSCDDDCTQTTTFAPAPPVVTPQPSSYAPEGPALCQDCSLVTAGAGRAFVPVLAAAAAGLVGAIVTLL